MQQGIEQCNTQMQIKLKYENARCNSVDGMGILKCNAVHENHAEKTNMACKICINVKHMQNSQKCTKTENKSHKIPLHT